VGELSEHRPIQIAGVPKTFIRSALTSRKLPDRVGWGIAKTTGFTRHYTTNILNISPAFFLLKQGRENRPCDNTPAQVATNVSLNAHRVQTGSEVPNAPAAHLYPLHLNMV